VSRSEEPLKKIASEYPGRFVYVAGDLLNDDTIKEVIKKAIDTFGQINSVVLNAGVLEPIASIADANIDEWRKLYNINVLSPLSLASKAIPYLRSTSGRIVFVSSNASVINYHAWGAYGSSKATINHIASSIAAEEPSIFSISIAPGVVDTDMQVQIREDFKENMSEENHANFIALKETGQLLPAHVPAGVLANLALYGKGDDINGKYFDYDAKELAAYNK
jgi:NAD(P)-dependent dehydrogenase (short-subunit alcohol dehydrogenase family)